MALKKVTLSPLQQWAQNLDDTRIIVLADFYATLLSEDQSFHTAILIAIIDSRYLAGEAFRRWVAAGNDEDDKAALEAAWRHTRRQYRGTKEAIAARQKMLVDLLHELFTR